MFIISLHCYIEVLITDHYRKVLEVVSHSDVALVGSCPVTTTRSTAVCDCWKYLYMKDPLENKVKSFK
jgi:hypothetical protein